MINIRYKKLVSNVITIIAFLMLLSNFSYANSYSNNSISIEVNPEKRAYDYKDDINLNIKIENRNRYANLFYKITEIYTGGGFNALNLSSGYEKIDSFSSKEMKVTMHDNFINERPEVPIDTHITFNDGYHSKTNRYNIGHHAYELTEEEFLELKKFRKEKVKNERLSNNESVGRLSEEKENFTRGANATLLIIIIIVLICIILVIFIWFIIKTKSKDGTKFLSFLLIIGLISLTINKSIYAADTYQEGVTYNKDVNTRCTYWDLDCSFTVKVEYYFENTIAPITDLALDTDNDNLPDYLEVLYLTDLNNSDTDGDGIPDGDEVYYTFTDPNREDTDNNGINDGDEDYDKDGLTNKEEVSYGTRPDEIDTDFDSISDFDEINGVKTKNDLHTYQTDPTSDDTDSDGLRDDVELKLNLNPTNPSDANTKVYQEMDKTKLPNEINEAPIPVSFKGNLKGSIDENVKVKLIDNSLLFDLEGLVGDGVHIDTTYNETDGLKIVFDVSKYNHIKDRLQLCRYESGILTIIEGTYLNGDKLLGNVYSGDYVLLDSKKVLQDLNVFMN